jgi:hypothetical protein
VSEKTVEKKLPVRNLERIAERVGLPSYEAAAEAKQKKIQHDAPVAKVKVFRRSDGTFDVVWYKKIGAPAKVAQAPEKASEPKEKAVHGLKSKDRKKSPKKPR